MRKQSTVYIGCSRVFAVQLLQARMFQYVKLGNHFFSAIWPGVWDSNVRVAVGDIYLYLLPASRSVNMASKIMRQLPLCHMNWSLLKSSCHPIKGCTSFGPITTNHDISPVKRLQTYRKNDCFMSTRQSPRRCQDPPLKNRFTNFKLRPERFLTCCSGNFVVLNYTGV